MLDYILLLIAGFVGGVINSIAGGGSFVTFPALLAVGVPPISANATNTFASCAGYLSGAYAFKEDIKPHKKALPKLTAISLLGGLSGAVLLLNTGESNFSLAIPWLLLLATLLFIFGQHINQYMKQKAQRHAHASGLGDVLLYGLLFLVGLYGGFFNAGLGIITLSYLALAGYTNINAMNGLKLLISVVVSLIAIVLFIVHGAIAWQEGLIVLFGTLLGGYFAAHLSKTLPRRYVHTTIVISSCVITLYFFIQTYTDL